MNQEDKLREEHIPHMYHTDNNVTGELKVKNFICSEHGRIKPTPTCPKCKTNLLSLHLQEIEKSVLKMKKEAVNVMEVAVLNDVLHLIKEKFRDL